MDKVCDRCGREIPASEPAVEAAADTYWCEACEEAWRNDPLRLYRDAMACAEGRIENMEHPYTYERVGTEHGIAWRLTWWTPNLTAEEAQTHLARDEGPLSWDEALADMDDEE